MDNKFLYKYYTKMKPFVDTFVCIIIIHGMAPKSSTNIVAIPISPVKLSEMIKTRAINRNNILFLEGAMEQQNEQAGAVEVTTHDVHRALDLCSVDTIESIESGHEIGEWRAVVTFRPRGEGRLYLVDVVSGVTGKLLIMTVNWKDTL